MAKKSKDLKEKTRCKKPKKPTSQKCYRKTEERRLTTEPRVRFLRKGKKQEHTSYFSAKKKTSRVRDGDGREFFLPLLRPLVYARLELVFRLSSHSAITHAIGMYWGYEGTTDDDDPVKDFFLTGARDKK